jgi:hypothetical protein
MSSSFHLKETARTHREPKKKRQKEKKFILKKEDFLSVLKLVHTWVGGGGERKLK